MKKSFVMISIIIALVCSINTPAFAVTWNGLGGDDEWNTPANWAGGVAPVAGDPLVFAGLVRLTPNNDIAADPNFISITFNNTAGAFTLSGNRITLGGNITNNDIQLQTIDLDMILDAGRTINATNGDVTVNGDISETGGRWNLTKAQANTLTLSGDNTYTGRTLINNGTLSAASLNSVVGGSASSNLGAPNTVARGTIGLGNLGNTGTLLYTGTGETTDRVVDLRADGGGDGIIDQSGTGLLRFTSNFTATGTSAKTLTLQGSTAGTGEVSGAIVDGGGFATSFIKTGTGTWTLSGASTYTGGTTITNGILRVGNAAALGAGNVANNATLDIGSTALNVTGTYIQGPGATLMVAVNGTSSGSIVATLNATVNAGDPLTLSVTNYVPNGATYTIIDGAAGGGLVAAPAITVTGGNQATFTATTVGDDLILTASRSANGFASIATAGDSNAQAVGTVLDTITSPSADMTTVLNTMGNLSNSQVAAALDTLVPEVDAGVINTTTTILNNFVGVSLDRVEEGLRLAQNTADSATTGMSAGEASRVNGIWAKGYGSYLDQGTRNGIAGYDAWNAGTALGIDRMFLDCITLGISGGYAYGNVDGDINNANTFINSAQTTVYWGYADRNLPYFVDAAASFGFNWYQGTRDINIGGTILRTAHSKYEGQQYGAYFGGGYAFKVWKNIEFTPLASIEWNQLHLKAYEETEAGALNLTVGSQDYGQLLSGLGAKVAAPTEFRSAIVTPEIHGKWFYDFINDPMVVSSNFTGGGASFNSNGAMPARNSFNAGGKLTVDFRNDISVIGGVDTEIKDEFFGIYGSVTLRYQF